MDFYGVFVGAGFGIVAAVASFIGSKAEISILNCCLIGVIAFFVVCVNFCAGVYKEV